MHQTDDEAAEPPDRPGGAAPPPEEPSRLEVRYRRLLRLLPATYRTQREQHMVDTFLQEAIDEDPELADVTLRHGWPGVRDAAAVAVLAIQLRRTDSPDSKGYQVHAQGLWLATMGSLIVLAVTAALTLVGKMLLLTADNRLTPLTPEYMLPDPGLWLFLREWSFVLWIPALALAVFGGRGPHICATVLAVIPAAVHAISVIAYDFRPAGEPPQWAFAVVQVAVVIGLIGMVRAHHARMLNRRRMWLVAGGVAAWAALLLGASGLYAASVLPVVAFGVIKFVGPWCVVAVVGGAAALLQYARGKHVHTAAALGLVGVAVVATLLRASALPFWLHPPLGGEVPTALLLSVVIQLALVVAVTVIAGAVAAVRLRELSLDSYRSEAS